MKYINIGKFVNTHGIKGEIKLLSNFSRKDLVFIKSQKIYIKDLEFIIESYRKHKNFDMLKLKNINSINDIEHLKNNFVFVKEIKADYLIEDFLNYKLEYNEKKYVIKEIIENPKYKILVIENNIMVPFIEEFIEKVDSKNHVVLAKNMEGFIK